MTELAERERGGSSSFSMLLDMKQANNRSQHRSAPRQRGRGVNEKITYGIIFQYSMELMQNIELEGADTREAGDKGLVIPIIGGTIGETDRRKCTSGGRLV